LIHQTLHFLPFLIFGIITGSAPLLRKPPGSRYTVRVTVTLDNSYPNTGATIGYPVTAALFGLNGLDSYEIVGQDNGFMYQPDPTTGNIRVYRQDGSTGALTELANNSAALNGLKLIVEGSGW
jgi:hypothetical protein